MVYTANSNAFVTSAGRTIPIPGQQATNSSVRSLQRSIPRAPQAMGPHRNITTAKMSVNESQRVPRIQLNLTQTTTAETEMIKERFNTSVMAPSMVDKQPLLAKKEIGSPTRIQVPQKENFTPVFDQGLGDTISPALKSMAHQDLTMKIRKQNTAPRINEAGIDKNIHEKFDMLGRTSRLGLAAMQAKASIHNEISAKSSMSKQSSKSLGQDFFIFGQKTQKISEQNHHDKQVRFKEGTFGHKLYNYYESIKEKEEFAGLRNLFIGMSTFMAHPAMAASQELQNIQDILATIQDVKNGAISEAVVNFQNNIAKFKNINGSTQVHNIQNYKTQVLDLLTQKNIETIHDPMFGHMYTDISMQLTTILSSFLLFKLMDQHLNKAPQYAMAVNGGPVLDMTPQQNFELPQVLFSKNMAPEEEIQGSRSQVSAAPQTSPHDSQIESDTPIPGITDSKIHKVFNDPSNRSKGSSKTPEEQYEEWKAMGMDPPKHHAHAFRWSRYGQNFANFNFEDLADPKKEKNYGISTYSLGHGTTSEVFLAKNFKRDEEVAMKILYPEYRFLAELECKIGYAIKYGPFIIKQCDVMKNQQSDRISIAIEYFNCSGYKELMPKLTTKDIRMYMLQALLALNHAHSKGVIHRDIKPENIRFDHEAKELRIIDWGMGDFYKPGKKFVRSGTCVYMSPEQHMKMRYYDYQTDIWSLGCMLAGMTFQKEPFIVGESAEDQLGEIAKLVGSIPLIDYIGKYNFEVDDDIMDQIGFHEKQPWTNFVDQENKHLIPEEAEERIQLFDILDKMLTVDHTERITAKDAIEHPFFDEVRDEVFAVMEFHYGKNLRKRLALEASLIA